MTPRQTFLETLLPVVSRLALSPDKMLAAEAADEHARMSRELAKLKRQAAESLPEGAGREAAMAA